jgi:L,D-transpeptidase YcbB
MHRTPVPAPVTLAGKLSPGIAVAMVFALLLAPGVAVSAGPAAYLPPETLQLRVGALAEDPRVAGRPVADRWFLARFYERREFKPAWDAAAKLGGLLEAVQGSLRHGLDPEDYHATMLAELVGALGTAPDPALAVELELLATDALGRLAFHLRFGKVNPERVEPKWNFTRNIDGANPVRSMQALLDSPDLRAALEALAPDGPYYSALMGHLEAHRRMAEAGGWPQVEAGDTLRPDMRSPRVPALRARLQASGDLAPGPAPVDAELFDAELEQGVRRFQARHGLDVDGAVGRRTVTAMNLPVEYRIDQIRMNLERFRWVFRDLEPRFLVVNIPRFRVLLIEDQQVTWSTRAIVGRPYRQTPVFRARMTYLEFNPTWTVPPTILREDLLPDLRRDPNELQRRNMVVLDHQGRRVDPATIDWPGVTWRGFPYMIRQEPGPDNALGRVKFMFPNPHHVYMHDTPARSLFARAERTFSSGCIRLEKPFELVDILLAGTQWDAPAIQQVLASGRTRIVNLPQPIMVLILYGTAVPEGDDIHFAADIYGGDARLLPVLNAPFEFSPPAGYREALQETGAVEAPGS